MKGTVFILPMEGAHPRIILSDNVDGKIVVVNVSDASKSESTCYLDPGDHPAIIKRSAVLYWRARLVDAVPLEQLRAAGVKVFAEVLTEAVLQRIIDGARHSDDFTPKLLSYLE